MVILVAGMGKRLMPLTAGLPKCLVPLHGRALLEWQMDSARRAGIKEFVLVGGYQAEKLAGRGATVVLNPDFETTNMVESLWRARPALDKPFLLSYGDILCSPAVITAVAAGAGDISVVVDRLWRPYWERRFADPLKDAESLTLDPEGLIRSIGRKTKTLEEIEAQYIGLLSLTPAGAAGLLNLYERRREDPKARTMFMTDLLQEAVDTGLPLRAVPVEGGWLEIDSISDLRLAEELTGARGGTLDVLR